MLPNDNRSKTKIKSEAMIINITRDYEKYDTKGNPKKTGNFKVHPYYTIISSHTDNTFFGHPQKQTFVRFLEEVIKGEVYRNAFGIAYESGTITSDQNEEVHPTSILKDGTPRAATTGLFLDVLTDIIGVRQLILTSPKLPFFNEVTSVTLSPENAYDLFMELIHNKSLPEAYKSAMKF